MQCGLHLLCKHNCIDHLIGQSSAYIMTTTSVSTPNSSDNLTGIVIMQGHVYKQLIYEHIIVPALISVNVIVITLLSIITGVLVCYFIRKYFKTSKSFVTVANTSALIVSTCRSR